MSKKPGRCWRTFFCGIRQDVHALHDSFPPCVVYHCVCVWETSWGKQWNSLSKKQNRTLKTNAAPSLGVMNIQPCVLRLGTRENIFCNKHCSALPPQCLLGFFCANFKNCCSTCSSTEMFGCCVIFLFIFLGRCVRSASDGNGFIKTLNYNSVWTYVW